MKRVLFLLTAISFFSCTKEKEDTISGRWTIVESSSDVPTAYKVFSDREGYVEFRSNGEFAMDNSNTYSYYKAFKNFNRYSIISNELIKLYSTTNPDTAILNYSFHEGLILSYRYAFDRFVR